MDIHRCASHSGNGGSCGGRIRRQLVTAPPSLFSTSLLACLAAIVLRVPDASAREIHVAKAGNDSHTGSPESPFRSIGKAAADAQPGDTVTVHAGTYREWVKPARGGRDENSRIT